MGQIVSEQQGVRQVGQGEARIGRRHLLMSDAGGHCGQDKASV